MHVALMVEMVQARYPHMSTAWISRQVNIRQPHLVAYLKGRGHVGEAKLLRLRRWCIRLL
jgi:hypothetical protein